MTPTTTMTHADAAPPRRFALFEYGFRPFFLMVGLYGVLTVAAWLAILSGHLQLADAWIPSVWHAHEMIFGFAIAGIAGFMLTAVPNWTGCPPVRGAHLASLAALWCAGRAALWLAGTLPAPIVAAVDLAFLPVLAAAPAKALVLTRNFRNLPFIVLLAILEFANFLVHADRLGLNFGGTARTGLDLGLGAILIMIAIVGGRIIPAFTTNALRQRGATQLPRKVAWLDVLSVVSVVAVAIAEPFGAVGLPALIAAAFNFARLVLWRPFATLYSPILWVLHLGYAWFVAGLLLTALSAFFDGVPPAAAVHALGTGAVGTMLIAVMSRAALGHTGRLLVAHPATSLAYALVSVAAMARVCAALHPPAYASALMIAGIAWLAAFGLFVAVYAPVLLLARPDGRRG